MEDDDSILFSGGSIIHPRNSLAREIVRELGKKPRQLFGSYMHVRTFLSFLLHTGLKEQTEPKYAGRFKMDRFSLHLIDEVTFVQSEWSVVAWFQLFARYGAWTLYSFRNCLGSMLDNFAKYGAFT
jgi:hypothetical protein